MFSNDQGIMSIARYKDQLLIARENGDLELWNPPFTNWVAKAQTELQFSAISVTKKSLVIGGFDGTVSVSELSSLNSQGSFKASKTSIVQAKRIADEITVLDSDGVLTVFQLKSTILPVGASKVFDPLSEPILKLPTAGL